MQRGALREASKRKAYDARPWLRLTGACSRQTRHSNPDFLGNKYWPPVS